jgi:diketogulonate reductase-like aldo/keto reductase
MYTLKKEKDLETAIRSALDSGYRLFDTAVMYDNER